MKIYVISLGCQKNRVDTEVLLGNLMAHEGMSLTTEFKEADLILINTCAFIESAKEEAISTIFDVINSKKKRQKLIVCGCLSTRYFEEMPQLIGEVDRFVRISDYPRFLEIVNEVCDNKYHFRDFDFENRLIVGSKKVCYVKISEGCNNRCAFCAIPLIRGNFVSRDKDSIIKEVKSLVDNGAREINLISQDTTNYGADLKNGYNIISLLQDLEQIDGNYKIRLLYLYPKMVTKELVTFIKNSKHVLPYFDLPLQHSEDKILKRMNRHADKELNYAIIREIKNLIPDASIRTTFIVGFPGETDEDFNNLIEFVKDVEFDHLGAFTYSAEEGTKAYEFTDQVPQEVKNKRLEELYFVQDSISLNKNMKKIGKTYDVIIDDYDEEQYAYIGRSYEFASDDIDGYILVYSEAPLEIGEVYKVKIVDADISVLSGVYEDED